MMDAIDTGPDTHHPRNLISTHLISSHPTPSSLLSSPLTPCRLADAANLCSLDQRITAATSGSNAPHSVLLLSLLLLSLLLLSLLLLSLSLLLPWVEVALVVLALLLSLLVLPLLVLLLLGSHCSNARVASRSHREA